MKKQPSKVSSPTPDSKTSGNINIRGDVRGTGNVVGYNSRSHVTINHVPSLEGPKPRSYSNPRTRSKIALLWIRLAAFLVALAGVLLLLALFTRLLQSVEAWLVMQAILAAILAALGISGVIRPQALVNLFMRLFGK